MHSSRRRIPFLAYQRNRGNNRRLPRFETLEDRRLLAVVAVNDPRDLPDFRGNDGVPDADPAAPGNQVTFRAAAEHLAQVIAGGDSGPHKIEFALGSERVVIGNVDSNRVFVESNIEIDGTTHQSSGGEPLVELHVPLFARADNKIHGLAFGGGHELEISSRVTFVNNWVGVSQDDSGGFVSIGSGGLTVLGSGNIIGLPQEGQGNVFAGISSRPGVDSDAIFLDGDRNQVRNNLIGVTPDGKNVMPVRGLGSFILGAAGILNMGDENVIGTSEPLGGNTIAAAFDGPGVFVAAGSAEITNNTIGLAPDGKAATDGSRSFGNRLGVRVLDGPVTTIVTGNTISNSAEVGLVFGSQSGASSESKASGNVIGLTRDGTEARPNASGISIASPGVQIGGSEPGQGNLIAGNLLDGINVLFRADDTQIVGNTIGLGPDQIGSLGNINGISIDKASSTLISGNTILGNSGHGIFIVGGNASDQVVRNTKIVDNLIGRTADREAGNGTDGIHLGDRVEDTVIGSLDVQAGSFSNLIAGNGGHGVRSLGGKVAMVGNHVISNGSQDVDTGPLGPNPIDEPDNDGLLNPPLIVNVTPGSTKVRVELPNDVGLYHVEFFGGDGRLVHAAELAVSSDNLFDVTIPGDFDPDVTVQTTVLSESRQPLISSEQAQKKTPAADLLIKGSYERDDNFIGDDVFEQPRDDGPQAQLAFLPLPLDASKTFTEYSFDIKLQNQTGRKAKFRVKASVEERGSANEIVSFKLMDDTNITTAVLSDVGHSFELGENGTVIFRGIALLAEETNSDFIASLVANVSVRADDTPNEIIDSIVFSAFNALVVNTASDQSATEPARSQGVPDVDPVAHGLQTSLRAAIDHANDIPGRQNIAIELPKDTAITVGAGGAGGLPEIVEPVGIVSVPGTVIDGASKVDVALRLNNPTLKVGFNRESSFAGLEFKGFTENVLQATAAVVSFSGNIVNGRLTSGRTETAIKAQGGANITITDNTIIDVDKAIDIASTDSVFLASNNIGAQQGIQLTSVDTFRVLSNSVQATSTGIRVADVTTELGEGAARNIQENTIQNSNVQATVGLAIARTKNVRIVDNVVGNAKTAVSLQSSAELDLQGNQIGFVSNDDGHQTFVNEKGISIRGDGVHSVRIGGPTESPEDKIGNTISGNDTNIEIVELSSIDPTRDTVVISGNLIGLDPLGTMAINDQSSLGILIESAGNFVIGEDPVNTTDVIPSTKRGNTFAGHNNFDALSSDIGVKDPILEMGATTVTVAGNQFGIGQDSETAIPSRQSILAVGASNLTIQGNRFLAASGTAIDVSGNTSDPNGSGRLLIDRNTMGPGKEFQFTPSDLANAPTVIRVSNYKENVTVSGNRVAGNESSPLEANAQIIINQVEGALITDNQLTQSDRNEETLAPALAVVGSRRISVVRNLFESVAGVAIRRAFETSQDIRVLNNSFNPIEGRINESLPIDLVGASEGRTTNDELDRDQGNNSLQNFPVLSNVIASSAVLQNIDGLFVPQLRMQVEIDLEKDPAAKLTSFLIEFALSNSDGSKISDGLSDVGMPSKENRVVLRPSDLKKTVQFGGLFQPSARSGLTHLIATATRIEKDKAGNVVVAETSEFSEPVPIRFVEPDELPDTDNDGTPDLLEDDFESFLERGPLGDIDGNGIRDSEQDSLVGFITQEGNNGGADFAEELDLVAGDIAFIEAQNQARIAGSGIVVPADPAAAGVNPGQAFNGVEIEIKDGSSQAKFKYRQEEKTNLFVKFFHESDDEGNVSIFPRSFSPPPDGTLTDEGIAVEFLPDNGGVIVTVDDNSKYDFNPREGFVADPFLTGLDGALQFEPLGLDSRLTLKRAGENLNVQDADGSVLSAQALSKTKIVVIDGRVSETPLDVRLDIASDGGFQLRDPVYVLGGQHDDVVQVVGHDLSVAAAQAIGIEGGLGFDSIVLASQDRTMDLTTLPPEMLKSIELLDVVGTGENSLIISDTIVANLNAQATLRVKHNEDDAMTYVGNWSIALPEVIDGRFLHVAGADAARLEIDNSRPFHNPLNSLDPSRDGFTSPIDALQIINDLNQSGSRSLPTPETVDNTFAYLDVNNDGSVSPIDALLVINRLNSRARGEGELHDDRSGTLGPQIPRSFHHINSGLVEPPFANRVKQLKNSSWESGLRSQASQPASGSNPNVMRPILSFVTSLGVQAGWGESPRNEKELSSDAVDSLMDDLGSELTCRLIDSPARAVMEML